MKNNNNIVNKKRMMQMSSGFTENCTIGIFILNRKNRGKGFGKILIWASCTLINKLFNQKIFEACIEEDNLSCNCNPVFQFPTSD